jgi:hypothetical protein
MRRICVHEGLRALRMGGSGKLGLPLPLVAFYLERAGLRPPRDCQSAFTDTMARREFGESV